MAKVVLSAIGVVFFCFLALGSSDSPRTYSEPASTSLPSKPMSITVRSVKVKKIGSEWRYFFDVRNNSQEPFNGSAEISLSSSEHTFGGTVFNVTKTLAPGVGASVYVDAYTGPTAAYGSSAITGFNYVVTAGGYKLAQGSGRIAGGFEIIY